MNETTNGCIEIEIPKILDTNIASQDIIDKFATRFEPGTIVFPALGSCDSTFSFMPREGKSKQPRKTLDLPFQGTKINEEISRLCRCRSSQRRSNNLPKI